MKIGIGQLSMKSFVVVLMRPNNFGFYDGEQCIKCAHYHAVKVEANGGLS